MSVARYPRWIIVSSAFMLMAICWQIKTQNHIYNNMKPDQLAATLSSAWLRELVPDNDYSYELIKASGSQSYLLPLTEMPSAPEMIAEGKEGEVISWYPNKRKKMQGTYHNGRLNGQWLLWYPNGQLAIETYWHDGIPDGKAVHWYDNGRKKGELNFVQGKGEGKWQRWYDNGQLWQDMMVHLGKVQTLTVWDKEGRLIADIALQNDKQNGVVLSWYPSGAKKSEAIFKQNELIKKTEWDENGNVINMEHYGD